MLKLELSNTKPLYLQGLFLCLISFTFWWISLPGLNGGFLLDDWPNLGKLDQVKGFNSLLQFVLSGISSQLGRPLSLLTFALQAEHWPHNPYPFKLVGLILHIVNAWLVYFCCYLIANIKHWPERHCTLFAGIVFGLWLFHPLNISTTFYVVQRMVLLAAFFSLIGILAFLWGYRHALSSDNKNNLGLVLATIGITITYVLGILSKENAILTGLGISALYFFLLRPQQKIIIWDKWIIFFCLLPFCLLFAYLCFHLDQHTRIDFTPYQRLLTESVVLLDYLDKIFLPTPYKLNIFNDGFPVYKELWGSTITIKAITIWFIAIYLAVRYRKSVPFLTFALFWFLSGHLLESTVFGLELYFEHRNYLPSLGIVIGIVGTVFELNQKANENSEKLKKIINYGNITIISCFAIGFILVYGAEINQWSHPGKMAISAITERPHSMRAHQDAAAFFGNVGDIKKSAYILNKIEVRWPSTGAYAQYLMLKCVDQTITIPSKETISQRFKSGLFDRGTLSAMTDVYKRKKKGGCEYLSWEEYLEYTEILTGNSAFASQLDDFLILQAFSYTALKQPEQAALALDKLPDNQASVDFLLYKTQHFAVAGNLDKSLEIIKFIKTKFGNSYKYKLTSKKMVDSIESRILQGLQNKK